MEGVGLGPDRTIVQCHFITEGVEPYRYKHLRTARVIKMDRGCVQVFSIESLNGHGLQGARQYVKRSSGCVKIIEVHKYFCALSCLSTGA